MSPIINLFNNLSNSYIMKASIQMKDIYLLRLNIDEQANFLVNVQKLLQATPLNDLHIEETFFEDFSEKLELLNLASTQRKTSPQTEDLVKLDKERGEVISFLFAMFRSESKHFSEKRKEAATFLYKECKEFSKIQYLPIGQQTNAIDRFISTLEQTTPSKHIKTLGLSEAIDKLKTINNTYKDVYVARTENQLSEKKINVPEVRKQLESSFQIMMQHAFASNTLHNSEITRNFVNLLNVLIDNTNNAYKHRKGVNQAKNSKKEVANTLPL